MIPQVLRQLGLNAHEIDVYLVILQHGKLSAVDISSLTKINRTTVYSITKQLVKQGVVSEDLGSDKRYFVARSPQDLDLLIRRQEHELEERRHLLQGAMGELEKMAKSAEYTIPKIVFIPEEGLRDYLYKQTPAWNKSVRAGDGIWWGFQDPSFVEDYQDWIDWFWTLKDVDTIGVKLLTNEASIEDVMRDKHYTNRQLKFWEKGNDFSATVWVNNDYLVMAMTRQKPHYLVEIYDKTLSHNMRQVFKGIWESIS